MHDIAPESSLSTDVDRRLIRPKIFCRPIPRYAPAVHSIHGDIAGRMSYLQGPENVDGRDGAAIVPGFPFVRPDSDAPLVSVGDNPAAFAVVVVITRQSRSLLGGVNVAAGETKVCPCRIVKTLASNALEFWPETEYGVRFTPWLCLNRAMNVAALAIFAVERDNTGTLSPQPT